MSDADGVIGPGRVAVVTGAASGIGRALAETFAAEGSAVVVADLDAVTRPRWSRRASATRAATRSRSTVDVSDAAAVERLAATTLERFGRVDVLCNNAGVSTFNLFRDQTLDDWKWVVGVNFWGVVHGMQTFVPIMREQGTPGHIVNTASIGGLLTRHRVHRSVLRDEGGGGVDLRDAGAGARDRRDADRRERAVPELGRHQGDGVGARPPDGARGRAAHRDGGVGAPDDPRRVHRARPA